MHSLFSFSARRVHCQSLELVTRYLQPGIAEEQKSRTLPSSWKTSVVRLPCSNPTPAGLLMSDHCDTAAWPLVCKKQRPPRKVFRSSIAWLPDSLSTLRSVGYPWHHARLASSCWSGSTARDSHPQGSDERFQSCSLHLIPLSQAFLGAIASASAAKNMPELASVNPTSAPKADC